MRRIIVDYMHTESILYVLFKQNEPKNNANRKMSK